jgi:arsenate reductase (thioredoxin)
MKNILILCTGNSCRSQMAEGFLKHFDSSLNVYSAGTYPSSKVSPFAITVMKELGIDISKNKPKSVDNFLDKEFDYVITVCDNARETCPVFIGNVKNRLHIGFEDPADAKGTEEEILNFYRKIRDEIRKAFLEFYLQKILKFRSKIILQFQHFHGCPNGPKMLNAINSILNLIDNYIVFENILINDEDAAKKYNFRGSPTLLINGTDIENLPVPDVPAMACRFYINGLPDENAILEKVLKIIKENNL